ncbi:hypothetical protein [Fimbriiglobus ruber]|uniref:Uncharacterized protein n=1 Tax=Fimbriiglobus ruber TaxID=1908690 RepID=A0A225DAF4_9BACT|nr:hypothetical protein [Fimbriiglobus ruber]OWK36644.1 hypothetical protein FRUB_09207 [Fimbriiglobus ruber]
MLEIESPLLDKIYVLMEKMAAAYGRQVYQEKMEEFARDLAKQIENLNKEHAENLARLDKEHAAKLAELTALSTWAAQAGLEAREERLHALREIVIATLAARFDPVPVHVADLAEIADENRLRALNCVADTCSDAEAFLSAVAKPAP